MPNVELRYGIDFLYPEDREESNLPNGWKKYTYSWTDNSQNLNKGYICCRNECTFHLLIIQWNKYERSLNNTIYYTAL